MSLIEDDIDFLLYMIDNEQCEHRCGSGYKMTQALLSGDIIRYRRLYCRISSAAHSYVSTLTHQSLRDTRRLNNAGKRLAQQYPKY